MRWITSLIIVVVATSVAASESWDRKAAAQYLDARAEMWVTRSRTRQKLPTSCISCHTALPYLLSRASLGSQPKPAQDLFEDVEARVDNWDDVKVWYDTTRGEEKPTQSWGTESILNALVLTTRDRRDQGALTDEAKTALQHMWAQQNDEGFWAWLHFGLGPWEADTSEYWGAALAAVAAMSAGNELAPPADNLAKLRGYLRSGIARDLNVNNRLGLLWAASVWDGLLFDAERHQLVDDVLARQQPDGGFRLHDLAPWPSQDGTPPSKSSDGLATALATFVLQKLDEPRASEAINRGVSWLEQNQKADGRWETLSLNKDRSKEEDFRRLLMSDAATGYAVLALTFAADASTSTDP